MYFVQYGIGLFVHVVYVAILLITKYDNIQLPVGAYSRNVWQGSDVMGYVRPAESLLEKGQFIRHGNLDFHRTIGYPLFLAGMMKSFGGNWLICTYFVQAVLLALIYPILSIIARLLFPGIGNRVLWGIFGFSLFGTAYWSYAPQILTDGMFSLFFLAGVCCGVLSIVRRSWLLCLMEILLVGYSAQIRPVLVFFPVANVFLMLLVGRQNHLSMDRRLIGIIVVSSVTLAVASHGPAIRNFFNYGVLQPTDVLANNLAQYLSRQVVSNNGRQYEYDNLKAELNRLKEVNDFKGVIDIQNKFARETFKTYPGTTVMVLAYNVFWNMFEFQWQNTFSMWRKNWLSTDASGKARYVRSVDAVIVASIWVVIYGVVYFSFFWFMLDLARTRDWLFMVTILFFFIPLLPTFIAGQGARMRLFVEGLILICASSKFLNLHMRKSNPDVSGLSRG